MVGNRRIKFNNQLLVQPTCNLNNQSGTICLALYYLLLYYLIFLASQKYKSGEKQGLYLGIWSIFTLRGLGIVIVLYH